MVSIVVLFVGLIRYPRKTLQEAERIKVDQTRIFIFF